MAHHHEHQSSHRAHTHGDHSGAQHAHQHAGADDADLEERNKQHWDKVAKEYEFPASAYLTAVRSDFLIY